MNQTTGASFRHWVGVFAPPVHAVKPLVRAPLIQDPLTVFLVYFSWNTRLGFPIHQCVTSGEDWFQWVSTPSWRDAQSKTLAVKFSRQHFALTFLLFANL